MSSFTESKEEHGIHIPKIVITGGPCSGKTTGMVRLQDTLKGLGYRVFIAPEAATLFFLAGIQFADLPNPALSTAFQKSVINGQLHLENSLARYARATGQKSIILCDRGAMDGKAYMDDEAFDEILDDANLNLSTASAGRYDAVFHLVTAADGAASHYTLENNETRTESAEFACVIDKKTQAAWAGHPKHYIIDNSGGGFEEKMDRLISTMLHCIGQGTEAPAVAGKEMSATSTGSASSGGVYHFELDGVAHEDVLQLENLKTFHVEKRLLSVDPAAPPAALLPLMGLHCSGPCSDLVRLELHRQHPELKDVSEEQARLLSVYSLVQVRGRGEGGQPSETARILSSREYDSMLALFPLPALDQKRYCFIWQNQVMHLFQHMQPEGPWAWSLTVYCTAGQPALPECLRAHSMKESCH